MKKIREWFLLASLTSMNGAYLGEWCVDRYRGRDSGLAAPEAWSTISGWKAAVRSLVEDQGLDPTRDLRFKRTGRGFEAWVGPSFEFVMETLDEGRE